MDFIVETKNLTKYYHDILAVDKINLEIFRGEIFGLLGPNGSGKTTTIRMLTGQTKPNSGIARVAGYDIVKESLKAKRQIGVVPEISNLYDEMTAIDNLIFAGQLYNVRKSERIKKGEDLLKKFGLYERRKEYISNFSRGMKRRLTIAAALIHKPNILFLDEPTTGLDVQSTRLIRRLLKELNEDGATIFLTTHYIEEADQLCNRVAIINNGKIIKVDTPEKLKESIENYHVIEVSFNISDNFLDKLERLPKVKEVVRFGDKFRLFI